MPRWMWFLPLAVLATALAGWGFRWGWIAATITETDVITTYAQRYLDETGRNARLTDCAGVPGGQSGVWIVVRCIRDGARYDYPVDRFGRLLDVPGNAERPAEPQT
ncbi:hypothetical protein [uncultured Roseobacter sp.]|uniref:hypothetical protein n=1 Tax=uncultured Roseobacter sp. TaxID=114847 RepID=UPI00262F2BF9|nr:hypothetical protein [uncultured Roseobacter sp.]